MIDVWRIIKYAKATLNFPYEWGAKGPAAFDCSGVIAYAARMAGIKDFPLGTCETQVNYCLESSTPAYIYDPATNKIVALEGDAKCVYPITDTVRKIPGVVLFERGWRNDEDTGERFDSFVHVGIIVNDKGYTVEGYNEEDGIKMWKRAFKKKDWHLAAFIPGVVYSTAPGSVKGVKFASPIKPTLPSRDIVNPMNKAIPKTPMSAADISTTKLYKTTADEASRRVYEYLGGNSAASEALAKIAKQVDLSASTQPVDYRQSAMSPEVLVQAIEVGMMIDQLRMSDAKKFGKSNAEMTQAEFLTALGILSGGGMASG